MINKGGVLFSTDFDTLKKSAEKNNQSILECRKINAVHELTHVLLFYLTLNKYDYKEVKEIYKEIKSHNRILSSHFNKIPEKNKERWEDLINNLTKKKYGHSLLVKKIKDTKEYFAEKDVSEFNKFFKEKERVLILNHFEDDSKLKKEEIIDIVIDKFSKVLYQQAKDLDTNSKKSKTNLINFFYKCEKEDKEDFIKNLIDYYNKSSLMIYYKENFDTLELKEESTIMEKIIKENPLYIYSFNKAHLADLDYDNKDDLTKIRSSLLKITLNKMDVTKSIINRIDYKSGDKFGNINKIFSIATKLKNIEGILINSFGWKTPYFVTSYKTRPQGISTEILSRTTDAILGSSIDKVYKDLKDEGVDDLDTKSLKLLIRISVTVFSQLMEIKGLNNHPLIDLSSKIETDNLSKSAIVFTDLIINEKDVKMSKEKFSKERNKIKDVEQFIKELKEIHGNTTHSEESDFKKSMNKMLYNITEEQNVKKYGHFVKRFAKQNVKKVIKKLSENILL